jgi:tetratricopeptide (TPR) repeat protein
MFPASVLRSLTALAAFLCFSAVGWAQHGAFSGKVKGPDGKPLQNAVIKIERLDIRGNYTTKTNRRGEYFHTGIPLGEYKISVEVDGKVAEVVPKVRARLGDPVEVDFDLEATRKRQEALQRAADAGQLSQEQTREMTPEQRAAYEKQMKERAAQMSKNKELNDAFNAGMLAMNDKKFDAAIEQFSKATELDPKQHVVWANLAEAYMSRGGTKTGAEQEADYTKGIDAYTKAIELKPEDAGYHNNFGLAYVKARKFAEAQAELGKAAQLDPPNAAKYYYNLGAILVNTGQLEPAGEAFKKAIEANPNHADAQYQYGVYLISKATTTTDGKVIPPPGTKEAFQKYLELAPTGMFAEGAKGMIATLDAQLQTTYENPDAKKKTTRKKN